jgi:hypothetical protein
MEFLLKNVNISPFKEIILQGGEPLFIEECLNYMSYRKYIKPEDRVPIVGEPQTISWKKAYMQYQKHKPVLTEYIGDK